MRTMTVLITIIAILSVALLASCASDAEVDDPAAEVPLPLQPESWEKVERGEWAVATLAGGCFWCLESAYEDLPGILDVSSGYSGGEVENPTYKQVISGTTGHLESVQIIYDPSEKSYEEILDWFWKQINPTDDGGQFVDRGPQYRTAIFYHDEGQLQAAETSRQALADSGMFEQPIVTQILPYEMFWRAEEYHQDYAKKQALRYTLYEQGSGRPGFFKDTWGREK